MAEQEQIETPLRPEYPKDQIKRSMSLAGGAVQTTDKPTGPNFKLTCSSRHVNWVSNVKVVARIGGRPRIGSSDSEVPYISCAYCGEKVIGGKYSE